MGDLATHYGLQTVSQQSSPRDDRQEYNYDCYLLLHNRLSSACVLGHRGLARQIRRRGLAAYERVGVQLGYQRHSNSFDSSARVLG